MSTQKQPTSMQKDAPCSSRATLREQCVRRPWRLERLDQIGNTPLLDLSDMFEDQLTNGVKLFAKAGGSILGDP